MEDRFMPWYKLENGHITICGYDVDELALFAEACRKQQISEIELHNFCLSLQTMVIRMRDPIAEDLKETLSRIYGHDLKWED